MNVLDELRVELGRMVGYRDVRAETPTIEVRDVRPAETPLNLVAVEAPTPFLSTLGSVWPAIARGGNPVRAHREALPPRPSNLRQLSGASASGSPLSAPIP